MSALRRMRGTDAEINFKPWIYQIARNAAIDAYRRTSHAVEVSMDADDGLRASDRHRLVGLDGGPDAALVTKERLTHLQGAFDELSDVHTRVLVMRELEGMSYREIGQKLDLTRPAVESALFRARRRLESEYTELSEGRRCEAMRATIARMAAGTQRGAEEHRLARHAKRCPSCLRQARELGDRAAHDDRRAAAEGGGAAADPVALPPLRRRRRRHALACSPTGANAAPLAERAAALVAAAALVGAGGAALEGGALRGRPRDGRGGPSRGRALRDGERGIAARHSRDRRTDGERAGARQASGRRGSGPAGGRAGGSNGDVRRADRLRRADRDAPGRLVPSELAPGRSPIRADGSSDPARCDRALRAGRSNSPRRSCRRCRGPDGGGPDGQVPPVQLPDVERVTGELQDALP